MDLFAWCVRLSQLLVGYRTHLYHCTFIHFISLFDFVEKAHNSFYTVNNVERRIEATVDFVEGTFNFIAADSVASILLPVWTGRKSACIELCRMCMQDLFSRRPL